MISGITAATFATAGAYVADVTPPERRAAGYGLLGAAFGLGFVLGPRSAGCSAASARACRSGPRPASRSRTPRTAC